MILIVTRQRLVFILTNATTPIANTFISSITVAAIAIAPTVAD
ncbi:MAG TPA: hypothetical protein VFU62_10515 [Hanamia sp.]|nr:hypothetical protein [Hanamia sp.]